MATKDALKLLHRRSPNTSGSVTFTSEEIAELRLWAANMVRENKTISAELDAARVQFGEYPLPLSGEACEPSSPR